VVEVTARQTAAARRETVLAAAAVEFARKGLEGASTDAIARKAGISQPYLFRLFGTKKGLFIAVTEDCFAGTLELFRKSAEGKSGEAALEAMGTAYVGMILRRGYGDLVEYVRRASGVDSRRLSQFFAKGMLLNVIAAMDLLDASELWAKEMVEAIKE
jgi:AcrR family transcriptional regulator